MSSEKKTKIILNTIGVTAIVMAVGILLYLATMGLMLGAMDYDFNKSIGIYVAVLFGGIFGCIFFAAGIGILKKKPWSRIALMVAWGIISSAIIVTDLFCINFSAEKIVVTIFWLIIAILGILQIIFFRVRGVKGLFKN